MIKEKVGFIGAGNMGEALMRGIIKANLLSPQDVYASDTRETRLKELQKNYGITTLRDNKDLVLKTRIIVLAVKPQNMEEVLKEIAPVIGKEHLVISIAAGITTSYISKHIEQKGLRAYSLRPFCSRWPSMELPPSPTIWNRRSATGPGWASGP